MREEKNERWREYVEEMDCAENESKIWNTIKIMDGTKTKSKKNEVLVVNGKEYIEGSEKANQFAKTYKSFSKIRKI